VLYFLYEWFFAPEGVRVVLRLLRYPTFRAMGAAATAFIIWLILGPRLIRWLSRAHLTEKTRAYSPFNTPRKRTVPTMGGALIVGATVAAALLWCDIRSLFVPPILGAGLFFGAIGAIDDLRKLRGGASDRGLPAAAKLAAQFAFGALLAVWLLWPATSPIPDETIRGSLYFPFVKAGLYLGPAFGLLAILFTAFASNAVNIADGMDGLAIVPAMLVALVLGVFAYLLGSPAAVAFLQYFPVAGAEGQVIYRSLTCMEVTVICGALFGAGAGFLWFNAYPATIFMGDTGSLALGGMLGTASVMLKQEYVFLIAGGLFIVETGSSFIQQVIGLRLLGRRIFYRAPLHLALLHRGMGENKVTVRLWIVSVFFALAALSTLKLR